MSLLLGWHRRQGGPTSVLALTATPPIAAAVLALLDSLPPADRVDRLRAHIALLDAALYAKQHRLAELAVAAAAADAVGKELIPSSTRAALEPDDDEFESLESDIRVIDATLEDLRDALTATEDGVAGE